MYNTGFPLYFGSEIQGLLKDFQGPKVAFSRTNFRRSLQHGPYYSNILISISLITVTVLVDKNKT